MVASGIISEPDAKKMIEVAKSRSFGVLSRYLISINDRRPKTEREEDDRDAYAKALGDIAEAMRVILKA